jgi:hypothetical protein
MEPYVLQGCLIFRDQSCCRCPSTATALMPLKRCHAPGNVLLLLLQVPLSVTAVPECYSRSFCSSKCCVHCKRNEGCAAAKLCFI